jgi:hypothetical protein
VSPGIFETLTAMGAELARERVRAAREWLSRREAGE